MSNESLMRGFFALLFAVCLGYSILDKSNREADRFLEKGQQRYLPYSYVDILPVYLGILVVFSVLQVGFTDSIHLLISTCFGIFLHISVYYLILLLLLPLLRKFISARVCATLWLLPNILYITHNSFMELSKPRWVIRASGNWVQVLAILWLAGFLAVLGWKIVSHLLFRRSILAGSAPVTDAAVCNLWTQEQYRAGFKKATLPLVTSPAVKTPLTVGFFRSSTVVILPERQYTPEELELIFRHEIVHISREDSHTKFFLVFCTAIFWFNPLMWIAMRRSADDLELSCDETVLLEANDATRRQYANLLLKTAGDERGFTTCLSASAAALRYRLGSIVKPRECFEGAILAGLIFFLLIVTCGHVALAYGEGTGGEYIFDGQDPDTFIVNSISLCDEHSFRNYDCTDEVAFMEYLESMELYRLTGNYADTDSDYISMIYYTSGDTVVLNLREHLVSVEPLHSGQQRRIYYCPDGIDRAYLESLLTLPG